MAKSFNTFKIGKVLSLSIVAAMSVALHAEDAYIEGTGTQALLTDAICNPNGKKTRLEVDFRLTEVVEQERILGLCYAAFESQLFVENGKLKFAVGDTWNGYETSVVADNAARLVAIADYGNLNLLIKSGNEILWSTAISNPISAASTRGQGVFGSACDRGSLCWDAMQTEASSYAHMRLYSLKVYEDGQIAHYYKPWKSSDGKHVGVKDLCTGRILLNYVDGTEFLASDDVTDDPQWDISEAQPTVVPETIPSTGEYVIDLPLGKWYYPAFASSVPVIKRGVGMLMLADGNDFGGQTVNVDCGVLIADYENSGLKATHLKVSGGEMFSPGVFSPVGGSFTAPLAESGVGTIEVRGSCGFRPYDSDLTINFGGQGAALVKGRNGYDPSELNVGMSVYHTLTLANDITFDKCNITFKNPGRHPVLGEPKPVRLTGYISNPAEAADRATICYWDGPIAFVGNPSRQYDMYNLCFWEHYNGTQYFEDYKILARLDWIVGNNNPNVGPAIEYFKNCNYRNTGSWDLISGGPGTMMTVDGGSWYSHLRFIVGYVVQGTDGTLVLTNDAHFACATLRVHHGAVKQYSGCVDMTQNWDSGIFGVGVPGLNNDPTPADENSGDSTYELRGGEIKMNDYLAFYVGASRKGTFIQSGGVVTVNNMTRIGTGADGVGRYEILGGTFNNVLSLNQHLPISVGEYGSAVLTVANTGRLVSGSESGVIMGSASGGRGVFRLGSGGYAEVCGFSGGAGSSRLILYGGTAKPTSTVFVPGFIAASVNTAEVSAEGGAIDTSVGDIALGKSLTAADVTDSDFVSMTHRWSFDGGSLDDEVGGFTATTVGSVARKDGAIVLAGGPAGSSQVKLGDGLIPTNGRGWTIEMWITQRSEQVFARIFACGFQKNGQTDLFISSNRGGNSPYYVNMDGEDGTSNFVLQNDVPYHLTFTMEKLEDGCWLGTTTFRNPTTGAVLDRIMKKTSTIWSSTTIDQSLGLWLGNGAWGDPDPNIEYREIRIYNRALSEAEQNASALAGENVMPAFRKTGANKLTLCGVNSYKADTAVEAGTLALAAGVSIPQTGVRVGAGATLDLASTEQTVKSLAGAGTVKNGRLAVSNPLCSADGTVLPGGIGAIGTLTLDDVTISSGRLVIDVASDGTCDCLSSVGALDVSALSLEINAAALDRSRRYTIIAAPSVVGWFKSVTAPRGWQVVKSASGVELAVSGMAVIIR